MAEVSQPFWRGVSLALPLTLLVPALVLLPIGLSLPRLVHGGGIDLIGRFLLAAFQPSLEASVLSSALSGLVVTLAMALLGWAVSLLGGILLGLASSRTLWTTCTGQSWPAWNRVCMKVTKYLAGTSQVTPWITAGMLRIS